MSSTKSPSVRSSDLGSSTAIGGAPRSRRRRRRPRSLARLGAVLAAAGLALAACSSSGSASAPPKKAAVQQGGTVTFALSPGNNPNYIFPLEGSADYTVANGETFSYLFWRPLYWFGIGSAPLLNEQLSLADPPVYSDGGRTVTIHLKHYRWSDGSPVSAEDVVFWMQLLKAEKDNWGAYVPGDFPDNVVSTTATSPTTVVLRLNRAYSDNWFTYNELSQIVPIPAQAWDKTSASAKPGNDAATTAGARAVYNFLNDASKSLSTYETNPLWQVVDGPFRLAAFNPDGETTMVPNSDYSGPAHARIAKLVELPFTSTTAEFSALQAGNTVDIGYVPVHDLPAASALRAVGYHLYDEDSWSISFIALNFANPTAGPLFSELYLRQAMQHLIDQPGYVKAFLYGAGYPTNGPVPIEPPSPYVSAAERRAPDSYDPQAAKALLVAHGWRVVPDGVDTCERPGSGPSECGAGIAAGTPLRFTLLDASGYDSGTNMALAMRSAWASVGIQVALKQEPESSVYGEATGCVGQPAHSTACAWQMADWAPGGYSWVYSDDYEPTGGDLFATGGYANYGSYSNPTIDRLITLTHAESGLGPLQRYEDALASQLPVLWIPSTATVVAVAGNLHGVLPLSSVGNILPEEWYFSRPA